jgi:hypothetical protein
MWQEQANSEFYRIAALFADKRQLKAWVFVSYKYLHRIVM